MAGAACLANRCCRRIDFSFGEKGIRLGNGGAGKCFLRRSGPQAPGLAVVGGGLVPDGLILNKDSGYLKAFQVARALVADMQRSVTGVFRFVAVGPVVHFAGEVGARLVGEVFGDVHGVLIAQHIAFAP